MKIWPIMGYCLAGIGLVSIGIAGFLALGAWIDLPVASCGTPEAFPIRCASDHQTIINSVLVLGAGVAILASGFYFAPHRKRLALVLGAVIAASMFPFLLMWIRFII
jgi:hypothetical protein